jgi:lambda repressor-like predicted transcriptional regulator
MQAPKEYPNMEMVDRVVNAMKDKGWSIQVIAIRTGIESEKLRSGKMTEKEENKLFQTASVDAKIDLDLLYED